jgi:hypothetical protein
MHMQIDMQIEMEGLARGRATAPDRMLEDELGTTTRSMAGQGKGSTPAVVKRIRYSRARREEALAPAVSGPAPGFTYRLVDERRAKRRPKEPRCVRPVQSRQDSSFSLSY